MYTHQDIHDLIQNAWENDLPRKVEQVLRQNEGKMLTARILDKLPGGKDVWRLRREYGMTNIENRDYYLTHGNSKNGVSILCDWRIDSFPIETDKIVKNNAAYFEARDARNHARMESMNTKPLLDKMAAVMNKAERAWQQLQEAKAEFEELAGYGQPFAPDRYDLEKLCGLYESRDGWKPPAKAKQPQPA